MKNKLVEYRLYKDDQPDAVHRSGNSRKYKKAASMGKLSIEIINELYRPIDAANRFINLALENIEENSQGRQFLLESKCGIRKMIVLLDKLNTYARDLERELREISESKVGKDQKKTV